MRRAGGSPDNRVLRKLLLAAAVVMLGAALVVSLAGGIDIRIAGRAVRTHGATRPLIASLLLFGVSLALDRRVVTDALRDRPRAIASIARWITLGAALSVVTLATRYGAFVAGGSDAYGYLSQAYGWARGELPRPSTVPLSLPLPSGDWLQTPLGYWPGVRPHTIVPSYAPGLPLIMAIGIRIADPIGPYLVVPLSAGLFVWATFVLGRRLAGPAAGAAAALLAAVSPIALFMSLSPMSDVPSAAIWTGALAASIGDRRRDAIVAGLCAALGILVRPNLVPLAILLAAFAFSRKSGRHAALYCAIWIPAAIAIGALNTSWYGSPFLSGYGDPHALYSRRNVLPNVRHYASWLLQSQSAWIAVAAISVAPLARDPTVRTAIVRAWSVLVVVILLYLPYERYEQWWYLRFLLPGFGALFALASTGVFTLARAIPRPWGPATAAAVLAILLWHSIAFARSQQMWGPFRESEHKYADVGAFIAQRLPANAVLLAMQHSGSIRYYSGRHTVRYDLMDTIAAKQVPAEIERLGSHPYLAIEDAEMPDVRRIFGLRDDAAAPWPYVARMNRFGGVSIFDLSARPAGDAPVPIEPGLAPMIAAPAR